MSDRASFSGATNTGVGRWRRGWLVALLLVAFVGVALAKPWPGEPSATQVPRGRTAIQSVAPVPGGGGATTSPGSSPAPWPAGSAFAAAAFTTAVPPPAGAVWTGLRWRRLGPDDPLRLVTSVVRWPGGYLAVASLGPTAPEPLIWRSVDGAYWQPRLDSEHALRPGSLASDIVATATGGLAALSAPVEPCSAPCRPTYVDPAAVWTTPDGRDWAPHPLPSGWLAGSSAQALLLAAGRAGLEAASAGPAPRLAFSTDGVRWRALPADTLPQGFRLDDLVGAADGFLAVGRWTSGGRWDAASLWSADGRDWARTPALLPTSPMLGPVTQTTAESVADGAGGLIGVGLGYTNPATVLWWVTPDGRRWEAAPTFAPLGPAACRSAFCALRPDGALVGDGERLVAVRGGADAAGWTSTDGRTWQPLAMRGDIPAADALVATLLPGGVLLGDGSTAWYGEAEGR